MTDVVSDMSNLTKLPVSLLQQLSDKVEFIVLHSVYESVLSNENITEVDIGIGRLNILQDEGCVKYKFIPSKTFEQKIIKTVKDRESPLTTTVEDTLQKKILDVYKELF
jgi:hypothetical protein